MSIKRTWKRHGHTDSVTDRQIRTPRRTAVFRTHSIQISHDNAQLTTKRVQHLKNNHAFNSVATTQLLSQWQTVQILLKLKLRYLENKI